MSTDDPLLKLADATAGAVVGVLTGLGVDVEAGKPAVLPRDTNPLEILPMPAVISKVEYVGGVSGGNVFATTIAGANQLAAAMGAGNDPMDTELSEIAKSAFGEAASQMLASAAAATAAVLGREVEVSPGETLLVNAAPDAGELTAPHITRVSFTLGGETCMFVQLVPHVFVLRMTAALEEQVDLFGSEDEYLSDATLDTAWLHETMLRLDAELGSTLLTADEVLGLRDGAVVVLNRDVDDPIELFVNGAPYASGRLLLDGGEWAVAIDEIRVPTTDADTTEGSS
ncbi:MAG: FliM/FliN family flagellar motor switch protein [Solirubrobacteraceae bacterium]|jgi:chemotaxis protein CheY-P-specific phosphatase CheC